MKKLLYIFLLFTGFANAQIVNIPDANFKAKLLQADVTNQIAYGTGGYIKIDANSDGEIQEIEAQSVDSLNIRNSNIDVLEGISSFSNLKKLSCSVNNLTSLNVSANVALTTLDCNFNQLMSLNVSGLTGLNVLYCSSNQLTSLNVSSNTGLTYFDCSDNQLINLNVSSNTALISLNCEVNLLTSLNVNSNTGLTSLVCSNNQLTSLNVSANTALTTLYCNSNLLTNLDVSLITGLNFLFCYSNQLTSVDVSGNTALTYFDCSDNQLTSLNVNNNTGLNFLNCRLNLLTSLNVDGLIDLNDLYCGNNLIVNLDCSSNVNLQYVSCIDNLFLETIILKNGSLNESNVDTFLGCTILHFICADADEISNINSSLNSAGINNVILNTYCSFTPGGNYNTITGSMLFDADNNGCDINDSPQPNIKISITNTTNQGATFTNSSGNYTFYTQTGSFILTPNVENPTFFNFSPISVTIPFANNNNNTTTQNFCISANGVHPDVEIVIAPITPARPGFDAMYQIAYKNKGNQMLSGNITFTYDDAILDFVSATQLPDAQSTGLLNWNYTNLLPFENRSFNVTLNVNSPTETPAVNIGNILNFVATITPVVGDENALDNLFAYNQTVVGSYDPNNIECLEGNVVPPSEIGNYLHYIINFENTGTSQAENIVVKTTIDETKFDVNSLQMLNTSHNAYIKQTGNVVEFIFENIALDTGGHGNVLLKIKSKNDLVTGDAVSKRADIFFDYNAPIDTGLVNTIFQSLSTPDYPDNSIGIYPNPTSSIVNIKSDFNIKSVQLYDVQGRLLQTQVIDEVQTSINISEKSNGIYFLKITSDKGTKVEKLIKE